MTSYDGLKNRISETLRSRPLGCGCAFFMLSVAVFLYSPLITKLIFFVLAIGVTVFMVIRKLRKRQFTLKHTALVSLSLILIVCLVRCFFTYNLFDEKIKGYAEDNRTSEIVCCPVEEIRKTSYDSLYRAALTEVDGKRIIGTDILLRFEDNRTVTLFSDLAGTSTFLPVDDKGDEKTILSYYDAKGIYAVVDGSSLSQTGEISGGLSKVISKFRDLVGNQISKFTSGDTQALVSALMTADRSSLRNEIVRDFTVFGISHLLAVSGMHLSIVFLFADFLLRKFFVPLKPRSFILMLLIISYMALCGFCPSVCRSGGMLLIYLLSKIFDEENDTMTSLLFSCSVIVLISPYTLFSTSFLMSFAATYGIIFFVSGKAKKKKKRKKINKIAKTVFDSVAVSFSAQIAVLPISAIAFGSISLVSPIATIFFSLLFSLLLYVIPFCFLLSFIPFCTEIAGFLPDLLTKVIVRIASFAVYFKELYVKLVPSVLIAGLLLILLFLILFYLLRSSKKPLAGALAVYCVIGLVCFALPRFDKPIAVFGVYKNNDLVCLYGKGKSTVIDLSDGSKSALSEAIDLLKSETGEMYLDELVLTHYHMRHISSFRYLTETGYPEKLFLVPPKSQSDEDVFYALCEIAKESGTEIEMIDEGKAIAGCGTEISALYTDHLKRSTHPVISFLLNQNGKTAQYLSSSAWELCSPHPCDILLIGEHGPVVKQPLTQITDDPMICVSLADPSVLGLTVPYESIDGRFLFDFE